MQESQTIIAFISTGLQKMKDWHFVLMALGVTAIGSVLLVIRSGLQVSPPSLSGTMRTEREERWEKGHIHWMHPLIADWSHILPTGYCRISEFSVKTLPEIVASALHPPQSVANTVAIFTICIAFLELSNKGTNFTTYLTVTVVTRCAAHYPVCTLFCWALDVDCALLGINVLRLYIAQGVSF